MKTICSAIICNGKCQFPSNKHLEVCISPQYKLFLQYNR